MNNFDTLRSALSDHVTFGDAGRVSYDTEPWQAAADPATIAALLAELDDARRDAKRLDWLLMEVSGAEFRRIGVEYSGNAGREDIDAAMKGTP